MKKVVGIVLISVLLISCNQHKRFMVSGSIKNGEGEMLYIEHTGLLTTTILDSVKLGSSEEFSFQSKRPEYPDFYHLRLGKDKFIAFAIDSCEEINIEAKVDNFATDYTLNGSETSIQMQQLRKSIIDIQRKANSLSTDLSTDERNAKIDIIQKDIIAHKAMARKMILENPRSTTAYFAIYQKVNDSFIFSPYEKADRPYFAAVATSYNAFMPDYERSKNLYSLVMDAIKSERNAIKNKAWKEIQETDGKGYIDITLQDKNKITRKLSDLEGKLVLIDFSAYENEQSVDYTFALREIYNKFHSKGLEIYQVSLDKDRQFWEKSVANIPWICVHDTDGPNSKNAVSYNVTTLPTTYLLNKQGIIVLRSPGFSELKKEIEKALW
jgi:peroxiredoxin